MELHQLRYFLAVAETGNFTRAARRSFVSQPSLSQQIKILETELGEKLFDRLGRRAELTRAGRALLSHARQILINLEDARRAVREESGGGTIRIGVLPSIGPYLLPKLLQRLRRELPSMTMEINEDFRGPLIDELVGGRLDLFLGSLVPDHPDLQTEILFSEPLFVALSAHDPLCQRNAVRPEDLSDRGLILLGEASSLGMQTRRFFGDKRIRMRIAARCAQVKTVKALVAAGAGLAIVPEMATEAEHPGIVYRAMSGADPRREIVLSRNRRRFCSRAETAFAQLLRAVCSEQNAAIRSGLQLDPPQPQRV